MRQVPAYGILEVSLREVSTIAGPYDKLPEPVDFDKLVTSVDTEEVPDPDGGRDPERDFMLRWAGWG